MQIVMKSLIFLDLGFCNLNAIPYAIGDIRNLERLNLQGNKFVSLRNSIINLSNLAYLNLAPCHKLQNLPALLFESASSGGKYFKTTPESRNHISGLYIFDCPICLPWSRQNLAWDVFALSWLFRLVLVLSLSLSLIYTVSFSLALIYLYFFPYCTRNLVSSGVALTLLFLGVFYQNGSI